MAKAVMFKLTVVYTCLLALVSSKSEEKCDEEVIQCIKDVNGGSFPIKAWTGIEVLLNRDYSIVWYSEPLVKEEKLTCITTIFGIFGSKDTYHHGCSKSEDISFKTSLNIVDKTFTISDYQGKNMKAYAVYYKKSCLGLYVCSPNGLTGPHITIYCPTKLLGQSAIKAEVEEAKAKLTKCKINDGVAICQEKCP